MGQSTSEISDDNAPSYQNYCSFSFFQYKKLKFLLLGLPNTGKTTILNFLKFHEVRPATITVSFEVTTFQYRNNEITIWDVSGSAPKEWKSFTCGAQTTAIIFVIEADNHSSISESGEELKKLLRIEKLDGVALLIFANKQDKENCMSTIEIVDKLELLKIRNRKWLLQECCAIKKEGIFEGINWLINIIT